jgi:vacuolar-type H+-ATPase subunit F/Vma7
MFQIVALGKSEFLLGFRLAGIHTIETSEDPREDFDKIMQNQEIGIIITDEFTMESLPEHFREDVEAAVKPVTVVVSTSSSSQDTLRKKIKKSIGVDLWKD